MLPEFYPSLTFLYRNIAQFPVTTLYWGYLFHSVIAVVSCSLFKKYEFQKCYFKTFYEGSRSSNEPHNRNSISGILNKLRFSFRIQVQDLMVVFDVYAI